MRKLDQLPCSDLVEPVDARDAVSGRQNATGLTNLDLAFVLLDLALDDIADFRRPDFHSR